MEKLPEEVSKMLNLPLEEIKKVTGTADDCEQVVKVNYRYKINWELGALIKLIIKEGLCTLYVHSSFCVGIYALRISA